jgi:predicted nucleotidyltransferase
MAAMTPATEVKRKELLTFIERELKPVSAVQAVIGIGSIATGRMRPDSDIDAVVFFDPLDYYIVPAEFIWRPSDGTFHSIFSDDPEVQENGIQFDLLRLDWRTWSNPAFSWPEGRRAEFAAGWLAYDRHGKATSLITERTAYSETVRLDRLDEAITWLDQHLGGDGPLRRWQTLDPAIAHDRLQAAYHYLVQALFAFNRQWQPWRNRQMEALLALPWLPEKFRERVLLAANASSLHEEGYLARAGALRALFDDLLAHLTASGDYSNAPIDQAFIRQHDEPGYAWTMDEWNAERLRRILGTDGKS